MIGAATNPAAGAIAGCFLVFLLGFLPGLIKIAAMRRRESEVIAMGVRLH